MKKQKMLALILSLTALLSMNVSAAEAEIEASEETAEVEELAPLALEDMERIVVTSADSKIAGSKEKLETEYVFDGKSSTGCTVSFAEDAEEKTISIYTATRVPEALQAISTLFDGETGTVLGINVYATNDSLLIDWKQLTFVNPLEKHGDYYVLHIANLPQKYSFYRIDITVENGTGFTLNELTLYKDVTDEPLTYYRSDGEVAPGETPDLIEVPTPKKRELPKFGLFFPEGVRVFRK